MKNQIESLSAIVDLWWSWVDQCLAACGCEINLVHWVKDYLLPSAYWQQQVQPTKNPELGEDYQAAYLKAQEFLRIHPITMSLSSKEREQWQHWAIWMVSKFQRSDITLWRDVMDIFLKFITTDEDYPPNA